MLILLFKTVFFLPSFINWYVIGYSKPPCLRLYTPFLIVSFFIFFENFFHITLSKNSGADPIPINPLICFLKYPNCFVEIQEPMLEPTNIKLFFLIIFFITTLTWLLHLLIFPSVNLPEDLPCPEYSIAKKPIFFLLQNFFNFLGFSPSKSDIKPCKKTT